MVTWSQDILLEEIHLYQKSPENLIKSVTNSMGYQRFICFVGIALDNGLT